jgi:DNA-binding transcriptional regulator LsrR (DeoR family)
MTPINRPIDPEESLATRAAWLHYVGGLTQAAVAKRLGVPSVKAHRLIARAVADGRVKVTIDGAMIECVELENRLATRFGLDICEVAPDLEARVIGLGHGRTLAATVQQLPRLDAPTLKFVSLFGGLTRNYSANPHDVMHRIAEKTGARAYVMPVPFFANTANDREVLLAQRGVAEVFQLANGSSLKLTGIGTVDDNAQLVTSGMIEPKEARAIHAAGGVGELLGHFFDAQGRLLHTALTARTLTVAFAADKDQIVAVAGGADKVQAIKAVLLSRHLKGLITDERTAKALLE